MSGQYYPVILKLGTRFIEAGFSGESCPIVQKRTNLFNLTKPQSSVILESDHSVPEKYLSTITFPDEKHYQNQLLWTYDFIGIDTQTLENELERIIHDIYTNYLLVDAKRCKVLVLEPLHFPKPLKEIVSKVLLFHMHAKSVSFHSESIMSCVSSGSQTAIVIDLGWTQTTVTPVFDLRALYTQAKTTKRGGQLIHQLLYESLKDVLQQNQVIDQFEFIERLIIEVSYCKTKSDIPNDGEDLGVFIFDGIKIPNRLRYEIYESVIFENTPETESDDDNILISDLVINFLHDSTIDLRAELANKIIFTGGLSHVPGIKSRILEEIRERSSFSFPIRSIVSLGPWAGTSLYCSTSLMTASSSSYIHKTGELYRDRYLNGEAKLCDWTDQVYSRS